VGESLQFRFAVIRHPGRRANLLRTFHRPFGGVSKWRSGQYVAVSQWVHDRKVATAVNLRRMLGLTPDAS
jgi:hypothetical protein